MSTAAKPKYGVKFIDDVAEQIKHMDGSVREPFKKVCAKKLAVDPEGYGLPLHAPLAGYWKHEFRTHRVLYRIYSDLFLVLVCAVGPRKAGDTEDVYTQFEPLIRAGKLAEQLAAVLASKSPPKATSEKKKKK